MAMEHPPRLNGSAEPAESVETLTRKLAAAKARVANLAEQLMTAERVQAGLRSRIASLERQLETAEGRPMTSDVIDLGPAPAAGATPSATTPPATVHLDYAYGDHEDDLLPRSS